MRERRTGTAAAANGLRGHRNDLSAGCSYIALTRPSQLLAPRCAPLRDALIAVSDEAFGAETAETWRRRFGGDFLACLRRFYLVFDGDGSLIGWSGYRARTIRGERVVYFDSTGLLPAHQGRGLIPLIQRAALAHETHPRNLRPINLVVRTRNPLAYRLATRTFATEPVIPTLQGTVPLARRPLIRDTAAWLGQHPFDPATARIAAAYRHRPALYGAGRQPRSQDERIRRLFATLAPTDALLVFARHDPHTEPEPRRLGPLPGP